LVVGHYAWGYLHDTAAGLGGPQRTDDGQYQKTLADPANIRHSLNVRKQMNNRFLT
jgi:hypothetical protein